MVNGMHMFNVFTFVYNLLVTKPAEKISELK